MRKSKGAKGIRLDMLGVGMKRGADRKQALLDNSVYEHEGGEQKFGAINESELKYSSSMNNSFVQEYAEEGSIQDWCQYFKKKQFELIPQYHAPAKQGELVYSVCSDVSLNLSPEELMNSELSDEPRVNTNFNYVYLDNRKELMCINLETYEHKIIYTAEEDIRSFQFRKDGLCFLVYKTNTIDIIKPTEDGTFERIQEIKSNSMQNNRIYISDIDQNYFYLRSLVNVYSPGDGQELPVDLEERPDIETDKEIYRESIKKLKFTIDNAPMQKVKFEGSKLKMIEVAEYSVYSNDKQQLQTFIKHEELQLGFCYDTYNECITILNLKDMMPLERCPSIDSGEITNMFIDFDEDTLYYQIGGYHATLQVEFETFDLEDMTPSGSIKIPNYSVKNHISTLKTGDLFILGMRNSVSFIDNKANVCIGEFKCEGRVDSIKISNDGKEIFIYTDQCKFYRIQKNQTKHFMQKVPNAENVRCFVPQYNDDGLYQLLIANDKFRNIDAQSVDQQAQYLDTNGLTVFNMEYMQEDNLAYAIMGTTEMTQDENGLPQFSANLYCIDFNKNEIVHKFDEQMRRDSKLLLAKGKCIILEPFRKLKMYSITGDRIKEIPVSSDIVQLDGMEMSIKHNTLLILCEKRVGHGLVKYVRVLDLDTYELKCDDIEIEGQTQPRTIRMCPKEKYVAISHSRGMLEVWDMNTMTKRESPRAYRIFKNIADSDFQFYYDDNWLRVVTLLSIKAMDYDMTGNWDTRIIIQNIDKDISNMQQRLDISAKEINLDYDNNIAFVRDKNLQLYHLDMNNFQMQSGEEMNYFRTELMRYYIHNYPKMSKIQRKTILTYIPFKTHFNWNLNLVSVLSYMGNKHEALKGLLDNGVPYISENEGETPMKRAVLMHDMDVVNVCVNYLAGDANQLEDFDTLHMIEAWVPAWKQNFMFQPSMFTTAAYQRIKQVFQGVLKEGNEIVFSESKLIGQTVLEQSVDFFEQDNKKTLMAQTFKIQLNFDFHTKICFKLLNLFMESDSEFFEQTDVGPIIDHIFERNKTKFMSQSFLHIMQALVVILFELYPSFTWTNYVMIGLATIILMLELIQITHNVRGYLSNPFNFLEVIANILVIITRFDYFADLNWVMILMICLKAILTLQIFESQRTLIKMIVQCIIGMIPFLTLVTLFVLTFAMVLLTIQREQYGETDGFSIIALTQYRVLFGENPEYLFKWQHAPQWFLYILFSILMCVVMLNLLISIISDEYDKVQATQRSTDLKAKCEVIYDFGQLELFFLQTILRHDIIPGETMYVHRFSEAQATGHVEQDGQWMGRVKVMTEKQNKIIDDLKDFRSQVDTKLDIMLDQVNENMDLRMDKMEQKLERIESILVKQEKNAAVQRMQGQMGQTSLAQLQGKLGGPRAKKSLE